MDEERIKSLIKTWREKSHQEGDPFASFVFIWFCLNAWMEHLSTQNTDAGMINELASRSNKMHDLIDSYDKAFAPERSPFKDGLRAFINNIREEPLNDSRRRRPDIVIRDENDFENIVRAIYRVRCNLFHGGKDANNLRDQELVKKAALILREWIGMLVQKWN